jgi:hypothetical protein
VRNLVTKLNQSADAGRILDRPNAVAHNAADKDVTREKRLYDAGQTTPRHFFNAKFRKKNLQAKVLMKIGGRDMLMLWLRSGAIPRWIGQMHFGFF